MRARPTFPFRRRRATSTPMMEASRRGPVQRIDDRTFLLLLFAVTLAFGWVLYPFYGAVLWAIIIAVIFAPVNRRLLAAMPGRQSRGSSATPASART